MDKVYCEDCARWYGTTDQCEIPSSGIQLFLKDGIESDEAFQCFLNYINATRRDMVEVDETAIKFIRSHMPSIHYCNPYLRDWIYGKPSRLNKNNDCYFFLPKPSLRRRIRRCLTDRLRALFGIAIDCNP